METPQLVFGLSLILLIQATPSQLTDDTMMQKSGTWIRDVLQKQLETESYKGTFTGATTLQNKPSNRQTPLFSGPTRIPKTWNIPGGNDCQLRRLAISVRELGLGYDSDEFVAFKYCSGTCAKSYNNHDMALSFLIKNSKIHALENPCCRPVLYENEVFLDTYLQWYNVNQLSASACRCI